MARPNGATYDGMGKYTYAPKELHCMIMGGQYEPTFLHKVIPKLPVHLRPYGIGKSKFAYSIFACQAWCNRTYGCKYFNVEFPARTCGLARADAKLQFPMFKVVAGPTSCQDYPNEKPHCRCGDEGNDYDGDGVSDAEDKFWKDPNEWADLDGDGVADNADSDEDTDFGLDGRDAGTVTAESSGIGGNRTLVLNLIKGARKKVGISVAQSKDGTNLTIKTVGEGLVSEWNAAQTDPYMTVKKGDTITECNGKKGSSKDLYDEMQHATELNLTVKLATKKRGNWETDANDVVSTVEITQTGEGIRALPAAVTWTLALAALGGITAVVGRGRLSQWSARSFRPRRAPQYVPLDEALDFLAGASEVETWHLSARSANM
jgi:hypothetical protein